MKIFLTGITGYIGNRLAEKLLSTGHEVHALIRNKRDNSFPSHEKLVIHIGDLFDIQVLTQAMKECEAVFHLAAIAKVWMPDSSAYYNVNVKGTTNVLDTALAIGVKKVVYTSSGATYGVSTGVPLTEEDVRMHPFFTEYESSKFIAEERIQHYVRKGFNVVIVHPTKVYGPGIWTESNAASQMIKRYVEGKWHIIPGNGNMIGNFVYIDDVVNGHLQALEKGRPGEKYILGGVNVSFNEFFSALNDVSGKTHWTLHIPYRLMMLFGWKEEVCRMLFGKAPKITRAWIKKYNHDLELSSDKAQNELGYKITPLHEGLKQTLDWIKIIPDDLLHLPS